MPMMKIAMNESSKLLLSEVVERILAQHRALREMLDAVMRISLSAQQGDRAAAAALKSVLHELRTRMLAHITFEETELVPLLRRSKGWGHEKADVLLAEHARQRAELHTLIEGENGQWDDRAIALILETLVGEILDDMEEEEKGVLSLATM